MLFFAGVLGDGAVCAKVCLSCGADAQVWELVCTVCGESFDSGVVVPMKDADVDDVGTDGVNVDNGHNSSDAESVVEEIEEIV